ncbi:MAG TPA: DUF983 domain-containing protein [Ktedonobacterales bacterium]|nr:DUF983 domain-containing protein [Ktedonobacterales bacterium]
MIPLLLLWRGVRLRCPRCGQGKLYRRLWTLTMYTECPVCHWVYEREEGYWTGAMAIDLVAAELLVAVLIITFNVQGYQLLPQFAIGIPLAIVLPIIFYPHAKSLWMTLDFLLHPTALL